MDQRELLPIEHRSLQPSRTRASKALGRSYVNPEAIYAAEWRKFQRQWRGCGLLPLLLSPDGYRNALGEVIPVPVSRRDAAVAATIIQWLGTNVGRGFVNRCEAVIKALQERQNEVAQKRWRERPQSDGLTPLQRRKQRLDAARARLRSAK